MTSSGENMVAVEVVASALLAYLVITHGWAALTAIRNRDRIGNRERDWVDRHPALVKGAALVADALAVALCLYILL